MTAGRDWDLKDVRPTFERPPVIEQAITAMFAAIPGFTVGHFGLFWSLIRDEFPHCVGQPALSNVTEGFGAPEPVTVELIQGAPPVRALYQSASTGELVQAQSDRFSFNWKLTPDSQYPRYDATLPRFWSLFDAYTSFLEREGLGTPALTQCELTNVNIIPIEDFGASFAELTNALALDLPTLGEYRSLALENSQVAVRYIMSRDDGAPIGRLHVSVQTVYNVATSKPAIRMDLTARGGSPAMDRTAANEFFSEARNAINAAFLSYTSAEAQAFWGKK